MRIDPATGRDTADLDLRDFLGSAWHLPVGYVIDAYNDMTVVRDGGGDRVLIGLETFIPARARLPDGHASVSVGYARLEGGGWYLLRDHAGHYGLRQIDVTLPTIGKALVATRSSVASPFVGDGDGVYFAGYDANKATAHNTAWIVRGTRAAIFGRK